MANYIYGAVALTGGVSGSLDALDGSDLTDNDAAIVFTSNATYIYTLDESSGGTQNIPELIIPSNNAGNKRWVLVSSRAAESSLDAADFTGILDASMDDVQKALDAIDDMFNTDDFTVTPGNVDLKDSIINQIGTDLGMITPSSHQISFVGSGKINTTGAGTEIAIAVDDLSIVTKSESYSVTTEDDIVIGDTAGGNITITLPPAADKSAVYISKKSFSNSLVIACYGSETIESQSTFTLLDEYDAVRLISDGVNTWVTSALIYELPTATDSVAGGVKVGDNLQINSGG